jgi:diaminohydroxyphosphoribosylaminopyrimidine deaminase/5-amino-6-(5-phosphoribosylamino)uracil reductase
MSRDQEYIQQCFELAKRGAGHVSPNPLVGCVVVKDDRVIATGFHQQLGGDHAERDALKKLTIEEASGATLYCNLEPCSHTKKRTPPCVPLIIEYGIKRVVVSNEDPNPQVSGEGLKLLQEAGIEVTSGVLESEGAELNEIFFTHITQKRPFIELKLAQTLDGRTATHSGDSKWITSTESREHVHYRRNFYDGILVGAHTLNLDNPSLTIRNGEEILRCPFRLVLTSSGELNYEAKLFTDEYRERSLVITDTESIIPDGIQVIRIPFNQGEPDYIKLMQELIQRGIYSLYIEGGSTTHSFFIKSELYDRISVYIAPKLLGCDGRAALATDGLDKMQDAMTLIDGKWQAFGPDMYFTGRKE